MAYSKSFATIARIVKQTLNTKEPVPLVVLKGQVSWYQKKGSFLIKKSYFYQTKITLFDQNNLSFK